MKPVVVKIGGGTLENPSIVEDLVKLQKEGGAPGGDPRGRIGGHPVAFCAAPSSSTRGGESVYPIHLHS